MKTVVIKTFTYPAEAYALKSKLKSEGIWSTLSDELSIGADPFLSNATGGIKLKVLEKIKASNLATPQKKVAVPKGMMEHDEYCPKCEEYPVLRGKMAWYTYLLVPFLVLFYMPPMGGGDCLCPNCGHTWK